MAEEFIQIFLNAAFICHEVGQEGSAYVREILIIYPIEIPLKGIQQNFYRDIEYGLSERCIPSNESKCMKKVPKSKKLNKPTELYFVLDQI
mmetsp:Transcript_1805/g.4016  ORF Transcript_1805/g.4016 Transcript_1805/m.4016 type:complete len:91 (+) Transcript_1805:404-676(+)